VIKCAECKGKFVFLKVRWRICSEDFGLGKGITWTRRENVCEEAKEAWDKKKYGKPKRSRNKRGGKKLREYLEKLEKDEEEEAKDDEAMDDGEEVVNNEEEAMDVDDVRCNDEKEEANEVGLSNEEGKNAIEEVKNAVEKETEVLVIEEEKNVTEEEEDDSAKEESTMVCARINRPWDGTRKTASLVVVESGEIKFKDDCLPAEKENEGLIKINMNFP
jgi:hypothetical protein